MKVSDDGIVESLCTTRCKRERQYMIMYIKLSAASNAKQCCHQRKPKEFHNCWTSNSAKDNNTDFWILMFSYNTKFIQAQQVHILQYIKQKLIVLQSNLGEETFKFDSNTEIMIWGTAYMHNCNEFCNNQTYLTAMYYGTGTQLKPSHPTFDAARVDLMLLGNIFRKKFETLTI